MRAGQCVDQLRGYANPSAALAHRTLKNVTDAKFTADLLHIDGLEAGQELGIFAS